MSGRVFRATADTGIAEASQRTESRFEGQTSTSADSYSGAEDRFNDMQPEAMQSRQRRVRGQVDKRLLACLVCLFTIGLLINYSASARVGLEYAGDVSYFLRRQLIWLALGSVAAMVAYSVDHRTWRRLSVIMMLGTLVLLFMTMVFGASVFGGQRWLLASGSIQPSEIAKFTIIVYIADWLSSKRDEIRDLTLGTIPFVLLTGVVCGLILLQNDLSTAAMIGLVATLMFYTAGGQLKHLAASAAMSGLVFGLSILLKPFRMQRIHSFLDPTADPTDGGYQVLLSLSSFQKGGLFGRGFGQGQQKEMLPVPHTDSVFAVLGEEMGLMGTLIVLSLFAFLVWRGLRIAAGLNDRYASLLATGLTTWIGGQALMNIAVATKTIPPTGITLPFISFGGSSLVMSMIAMGLLLNLSRRSDPSRMKLYGHVDFRRRNRRSRLSRAHRTRNLGYR